MDIYDRLQEDHREASRLMESLLETSEGAVKTREKDFDRLQEALSVHKQAEDEIFYSALRQHEETRPDVLESVVEHNIVEQLLKELARENKGTEEWTAKMHVLKDVVQHHLEEEEKEMFGKAKKILTDDEAEELGDRFEEAKSKLH